MSHWARPIFQKLPAPLQRTILRHYLVHEISHGRHLTEGESVYLPHVVRPGDVVWDIGANVGEYTFQLSRLVGPAGHVHAFEPMAYNFGTLAALIKRARLSNVSAHQIALSDSCGTGRMRMPAVIEHSLGRFAESGETVSVRTVDDLIQSGLPVPTFVKCDVEGNGPQVIAGAANLIRERRPLWLMEVWNSDEIRHMEALGYDCYRYPVRGGGVHLVHGREGTTSTYYFFPRSAEPTAALPPLAYMPMNASSPASSPHVRNLYPDPSSRQSRR